MNHKLFSIYFLFSFKFFLQLLFISFSAADFPLFSLRSKRFQSSYCAQVRSGAKINGGDRRGASLSSPPPSLPFFWLLSSQLFPTNSHGNACYAGYPLFCSNSAQKCLILPAEYLPHKSLILLKFCSKMPYSAGRMFASQIAYSARNSAGRTTHPSVTGQGIYKAFSVDMRSPVF